MPRYDRYGNLDDRIDQDGDVGFVGFNNRLRPDQLQAGMLADAQNIRTDRNGQAQVRKGVDLVSSPLSVGVDALVLPFTLAADDTDAAIADPDSNSGNLVITNITGSLYATSGTINLSNVSGITPDPNGDQSYTKTATNELTVSGSFTGAADASVTVKYPILNDTIINNIYGSADFSDPNEASTQYIIISSNAKAIGIDIANNITFDIGYPTATTISTSVDMIQAFNKVFIFQGGVTALENNLRISTISAAAVVASTNLVTITTSTNHNLVTGDIVTINALGFSVSNPNPNGSTKTITKTSDTQFTYALTTSSDETYTVSSSSIVATDFTKVSSGTYTQPVELDSTGFTITNGLATVTVSNTLAAGDNVILTAAGSSTLTQGDSFVVSEASSSAFKFFVNTDDVTNQTDVHFTKRVSVGLGFTHMPAPPFATYHQRRLVMPFQFSVDASSDSFTTRNIQDEIIASDILDTNTYDQVYAQYRFNAGTSDFVVGLQSFAEDRLLVFNRNSIHVVSNTTNLQTASTQVLTDEVGCVARQSIEQVGNQVIFLSDNGVYGTQFLDEYNLRGTETPLSEPINETIARINKNTQQNAVSAYFNNRYYIAVSLNRFKDNRGDVGISSADRRRRIIGEFTTESNALLAGIPRENIVDSIALENNAILIYNFLNKQWESIDTVNDVNYHITNLLVLGEGDKRGVYAVNDIGGVPRIDHRTDGVDRVITQIGGTENSIQISGALTTRQYTFGTLDRKRWKEFDFHIQSSDTNTSDLNIDFETENPDDTGNIGTLTGFNDGVLDIGEDVSIRGRIGNRRGYGIQFTFNNTVGRPIIRAIEVEGATTMRSTNKAI